jgi:DNA (cytosine-5)-methyltransferase 1
MDLFHGIGGFALGAYMAGMKFKSHYCSDIEPYCQKLYKLRFPNSIQLGDIKKIECNKLPTGEWIISGGFPCQDISIAGKGAGITGSRSGLWFEYWRIIKKLRPKIAIVENVEALVRKGLDVVLGSLTEIGYNAEWQTISARDVGAPHRRERIWIVAYANIMREPRSTKQEQQFTGAKKFTGSGKNGVEFGSDLANANSERCKKQYNGITKGAGYVDGGDVKYEHFWKIEPPICRVVDGLPNRVDRLRGLGNSVVPQIACLIFKQIKFILETSEPRMANGQRSFLWINY